MAKLLPTPAHGADALNLALEGSGVSLDTSKRRPVPIDSSNKVPVALIGNILEQQGLTPRTKSVTRKWSDDEDLLLQNAVKVYDGKNWKAISEALPDRSEVSGAPVYLRAPT